MTVEPIYHPVFRLLGLVSAGCATRGTGSAGPPVGGGGGGEPAYVNRSAWTAGETPPAVVTWTSTTAPGVPGGLTAVICESLTTLIVVAAAVPKLTVEAPLKRAPVSVTVVPPAEGPLLGLIPVTEGAGM